MFGPVSLKIGQNKFYHPLSGTERATGHHDDPETFGELFAFFSKKQYTAKEG